MISSEDIVSPLVRVWFIDVGAGDCTVVMDVASRRALLIDCPTSHVSRVQRLLLDEGASLDTVIVTHWDLDHYGGASRLAVGLPVRRVLYNHDTLFPSAESPSGRIRGALQNFLNVPSAGDILGPASEGQTDSVGELKWQIFAPTHEELTAAYIARKGNVASAVVEVTVPSLRILVGGDAVGATWRRLMAHRELRSDVLRWPHHGADLAGDVDGSLRDGVLKAIRAKYVVISAGASNPHGHPSSQVIQEASARSAVLCTQVTAGCFGYLSKDSRRSEQAKSKVRDINSSHCAGTICIECWKDSYSVTPSPADHESRIRGWSHPMCKVPDLRRGYF